MAYPVSAKWPTQDNLVIAPHETPIDRVHWDDGVVEKQHHAWKYRRGVVCNLDLSRVWPGSGAYPRTHQGYYTSQTVEDTPFLEIPQTSALWTPDDHDATVDWVIRVRYKVTGVGSGTVRVKVDDGGGSVNVDFTQAAAFPLQWQEQTETMTKLTTGCRIALFLLVSAATATVEVHNLFIRVAAQGTLGV